MSKLSEHQVRAMIAKCEATAAKHEAAGDGIRAAAARGRAHRYRNELAGRQAQQQPAAAAPQPAAAPVAPPIRTRPDDELRSTIRALLCRDPRYTLGALLDCAWEVHAELHPRKGAAA